MKRHGSFLTLRELAVVRSSVGGAVIRRCAESNGFSRVAVKRLMSKLAKGEQPFKSPRDY